MIRCPRFGQIPIWVGTLFGGWFKGEPSALRQTRMGVDRGRCVDCLFVRYLYETVG